MKKIKLFLTSLSVLMSISVFAQNMTVTGTVKDSSTEEPVPFAAIQLKGTMIGGMADTDGVYSIDVPADGVLIFCSVGYKNLEVAVASKAVHDVLLHPDTEVLEETIVVAFGTATKESFTGSATVVKSEGALKGMVNALPPNMTASGTAGYASSYGDHTDFGLPAIHMKTDFMLEDIVTQSENPFYNRFYAYCMNEAQGDSYTYAAYFWDCYYGWIKTANDVIRNINESSDSVRDEESKSALGLEKDLTVDDIKYGKLVLNCTKIGAGHIEIKAIADGYPFGGGKYKVSFNDEGLVLTSESGVTKTFVKKAIPNEVREFSLPITKSKEEVIYAPSPIL